MKFLLFLLSMAYGLTLHVNAAPIEICSFNIKFLGHYKKRDEAVLARLLKDYDIVVIQELIAPPTDGSYPNGTPYSADPDSVEFFDEMEALGFSYILSEEDTGTNDRIHSNRTGTEWWVAFYDDDVVQVAEDLPGGFLADDRSNHPDYERVPYAFPFRTLDGDQDFVLISVHLKPDPGTANRARRKHELKSISFWVNHNDAVEKDFLIVGDMNIQSKTELIDVIPSGWETLNADCVRTNGGKKPKPYDHVMFRPSAMSEIDSDDNFEVVDLKEEMRDDWAAEDPYPGDNGNNGLFEQYYSDHFPVIFRINDIDSDDD